MFGRRFDVTGVDGAGRVRGSPFFTGRLFGAGAYNQGDWSRAHTELPGMPGADFRKFTVASHPLAREWTMKRMKALPLEEAKLLEEFQKQYEGRVKDKAGQRTIDDGEAFAVGQHKAKQQMGGFKRKTEEAFVHDFKNWLAGVGKAADYSRGGISMKYVGQGKPLSRHDSVLDYLDDTTARPIVYQAELLKLKERFRNAATRDLRTCYLYWKYVVRGQPYDPQDFETPGDAQRGKDAAMRNPALIGEDDDGPDAEAQLRAKRARTTSLGEKRQRKAVDHPREPEVPRKASDAGRLGTDSEPQETEVGGQNLRDAVNAEWDSDGELELAEENAGVKEEVKEEDDGGPQQFTGKPLYTPPTHAPEATAAAPPPAPPPPDDKAKNEQEQLDAAKKSNEEQARKNEEDRVALADARAALERQKNAPRAERKSASTQTEAAPPPPQRASHSTQTDAPTPPPPPERVSSSTQTDAPHRTVRISSGTQTDPLPPDPQIADLKDRLSTAEGMAKDMERNLREELRELRARFGRNDAAVVEKTKEIGALRKANARAMEDLRAIYEQKLDSVTQLRAAREKEAATAKEALAAKEKELASIRGESGRQLAEKKAELDKMSAEIADLKTRLNSAPSGSLQRRYDMLMERQKALEGQWAKAEAAEEERVAKGVTAERMKALEAEIQAAHDEHARLAKETDAWAKAVVAQAQAEVDSYKAQIERAMREQYGATAQAAAPPAPAPEQPNELPDKRARRSFREFVASAQAALVKENIADAEMQSITKQAEQAWEGVEWLKNNNEVEPAAYEIMRQRIADLMAEAAGKTKSGLPPQEAVERGRASRVFRGATAYANIKPRQQAQYENFLAGPDRGYTPELKEAAEAYADMFFNRADAPRWAFQWWLHAKRKPHEAAVLLRAETAKHKK